MPPVNQQLLAKKLKLSRTTVSRSLANHPAISADTRKRVLEMASELGYGKSPTRTIRRSKQAKRLTIGVLIGAPLVASDRSTFPQILQGIRKRAEVEHAAVDVLPMDSAALAAESGEREIFGHIRKSDWRGVVLIYPFAPATVAMLAKKLSTISVLTEYNEVPVDVVDTDHDGVRLHVARLAALGHKRIGFVSWHYPVGGQWASRRFGAYTEGVLQAGLELNPKWVLNIQRGGKTFESPAAIADEVTRRVTKDKVTAWVCAADHQAYQLMSDLKERGLKVPEDCSLTGFDGNDVPPGLAPLATLRAPNEDIGASAVARLISRLLDPSSAHRKILVETEFIDGRTTGKPKE